MDCRYWHQLFRKTMHELVAWQARVREGVDVDNACDFARYVCQSGICELMRENPHQGENPRHTETLRDLFPYDGDKLWDKAREVEMACCEYWGGRTKDSPGTAKGPSKSDLEAIAAKQDAILARLDALEGKPKVELRVL